MHAFFTTIFNKYPHRSTRVLEVIPPLTSLFLISLPFWGAILFPVWLAYLIIFFDVFWLYKSGNLAVCSLIAARKIRWAEKQSWIEKAKEFPDFPKVHHLVIIPSYKESIPKIQQTIDSIKNQTFPHERLFVYLALEKREEGIEKKAEELVRMNRKDFGGFYYALHPDLPNEVKGKSSNQAYAVKEAYKKLIEEKGIDINFVTVTSCDADTLFDPQFYSYLSFKFLRSPIPHLTFWQSATVYYNNFWQVPSFIRVISFFGSLWRTALLVQHVRLIPNATYTLSLKLLKEVGYWDTDVIPEDYRIFFKSYFAKQGRVHVEPVFLKTTMDAAQSHTYMRSLMNKYHQERRWSWGVADDATYLKWWLTVKGVPFMKKTYLVGNVLLDHILWPVNWFIITISANLIVILNPTFTRTSLGYSLPQLSGFILTLCLLSILVMIYVDFTIRPQKNQEKPSKVRQFLFPLEFITMPVAGFFLSALPALISHIQLIIGKRLEYKVTEKV